MNPRGTSLDSTEVPPRPAVGAAKSLSRSESFVESCEWHLVGRLTREDHLQSIPVSTTHTITGAIVGVGSTRGYKAVRWGVAGNIVWAWILTIPCSAFMAAVAWWIGTHIF